MKVQSFKVPKEGVVKVPAFTPAPRSRRMAGAESAQGAPSRWRLRGAASGETDSGNPADARNINNPVPESSTPRNPITRLY